MNQNKFEEFKNNWQKVKLSLEFVGLNNPLHIRSHEIINNWSERIILPISYKKMLSEKKDFEYTNDITGLLEITLFERNNSSPSISQVDGSLQKMFPSLNELKVYVEPTDKDFELIKECYDEAGSLIFLSTAIKYNRSEDIIGNKEYDQFLFLLYRIVTEKVSILNELYFFDKLMGTNCNILLEDFYTYFLMLTVYDYNLLYQDKSQIVSKGMFVDLIEYTDNFKPDVTAFDYDFEAKQIELANKYRNDAVSYWLHECVYWTNVRKELYLELVNYNSILGYFFMHAYDLFCRELINRKICGRCLNCGNLFIYRKNKKYCSLKSDDRDCGKKARSKRDYIKHRDKRQSYYLREMRANREFIKNIRQKTK